MFIFMEQDTGWLKGATKTAAGFSSQKTKGGSQSAAIRRPHRGIQIKEDTYSIITIRKANGDPIPLISESMVVSSNKNVSDYGSIGRVEEYADYIIQQITDQRMEKQQIIETFGESYVFFFGERPRIMTFSGVLINSEDFNWRSQFWKNYDLYLRGSRLVQMNARAYITFDSMVIEGFPITAQATDTADSPYLVPFQMSMLVTNTYDYSHIGEVAFPGYGTVPNLDSFNRELRWKRLDYKSTTASVRFQNLKAKPRGGAIAAIRDGMKAVNDIMSLDVAGEAMAAMSAALGGRVIRMPIGIAGYLAQVGDVATVGVGTMGAFEQSFYDAKTGRYKTGLGSLKLSLPAYAQYAPVGKNYRTYKSENYDEYPLRNQPASLADLLSPVDYMNEITRQEKAQIEKYKKEYQYEIWNGLAEAGSWLANMADVVKLVKEGMGMVMKVNALISKQDWSLKGIMDSLLPDGAQIIAGFNPLPGGISALTSQGLSVTAGAVSELINSKGIQNYIGAKALETFNQAAEAASQNYYIDPVTGTRKPVPVSIGNAYQGSNYVTQAAQVEATEGLDYESAYGDSDYTMVTDKAKETAVDPKELYDNGYVKQVEAKTGEAVDPKTLYGEKGYISQSDRAADTQKTLDEVYGDKGYVTEASEIGEVELETLYSPKDNYAAVTSTKSKVSTQEAYAASTYSPGTGPSIAAETLYSSGEYRNTYVSSARMSLEERLALLQEADTTNKPAAEDTKGIRSVNDADAPIEPVI